MQNKIVLILKEALEQLPFVHAMWLEGSLAEKDNDEYSDLDIWLSVDDDKLRDIYLNIEKALETIAPIDYKFVMKPSGELGHNVYHLADTSEFLTLDINTQQLSRDVTLREGIDLCEVIFDKNGIIHTTPRIPVEFDQKTELAELLKFIDYQTLSVRKNALRGKKMESQEYYRNILVHVLEYLRKKSGISEKVDFGFKHVYKDIPQEHAQTLESFYYANATEDTVKSLKSWLESLE